MTVSRVPGPARVEPAIPITSSGLSPRGRAIAALLATAILLAATAVLAAAEALPTLGTRAADDRAAVGAVQSETATVGTDRRGAEPIVSGGAVAPVIEAHWDGPAVHLDWQGVPYARAETSFVGDRVAVPGDRTVRTLDIVNAGPATGVMSVVVDFDEQIPAGARNPRLGEDIMIFWELGDLTGQQSFSALAANDRVEIAELALDQDETVQLTMGFEMPHEVESSRSFGAESTLLRFDVGIEMRDEAGAGGPGVGGPGAGGPRPPGLAVSGGQLALAAIAAAVALTLLGLLLLALRRRDRRCDDCDRDIPSDEPRITIRTPQQRPETLCSDCAASRSWAESTGRSESATTLLA